MFFLVATMLGLFGSSIMPSIIRMEALDYFNYVSIITLFDPISIMDGTTAYLWKFCILLVIGLSATSPAACASARRTCRCKIYESALGVSV